MRFLVKLNPQNSRSGFSLMEILIVVAIIALFLLLAFLSIQTHIGRGHDATRKADLEKIRIAFENYYNDHGCYPAQGILQNCGSADLAPYLGSIPCDPVTREPYVYIPQEGDRCSGYRLFTSLHSSADSIIEQLGCAGPDGCGLGSGFERYNYGISSGVPLRPSSPIFGSVGDGGVSPSPTSTPDPGDPADPSDPGDPGDPGSPGEPQPTPTPLPTIPPGTPIYDYACYDHRCNAYGRNNPIILFCPTTYEDSSVCEIECQDPNTPQCPI